MTPGELAELFEDDVYREAAGVLEMISQSPEDRQFYESRMKFLNDEEARLIAARNEGREEGSLAGQIQLLQQLLGLQQTSMADLLSRGTEVLAATQEELQERLRSRGN